MTIEKGGMEKLNNDNRLKFGPGFLLTSDIEFGKFGAGVGNLDIDGFAARISNHSSGQDALAISSNKKTFVVTDGAGGAGSFNPTAVTKWSRAVAEAVARLPDINILHNESEYLKLVHSIKEKLEKEGIVFKCLSNVKSKLQGIKTTMSAVQRTGE